MKLFGFLKLPDINKGVKEYQSSRNAVLLDVRDRHEFEKGHIPGAINIPKDEIESAKDRIPDRNTGIYAYCYSGRRSDLAVTAPVWVGESLKLGISSVDASVSTQLEGIREVLSGVSAEKD